MSKNTIPMRMDPLFKEFVEGIRIERLKLGKDRKPSTLPRISRAIIRIPKLKEFLINSDFKNEK